nr:integrase, catalytic region, zinc finger, CCHC-type, peptidase aspartic, catalytic [Tanacetum cinerariifolium]
MANLLEDIQCAGSDTRPPMLDRTNFASWQQRIRLYCRGKDNGVNILKSIDEGPYKMGTVRETLAEKKDRYNVDIWATNMLLQGLPKDIYTLINHYTNAKDIWDNVKMLLEGSELTKEDRESQLYANFIHFRQHKEESIHDYYVRFAKLINDMRKIKMTMSRLQLNSKFVNNMLLEWGRFVTAGGSATGYGEAQNRVENINQGQARTVKCYNCNALDAEQLLFLAGGHDNAFDDAVDEQPVQDLALNVDNMFEAEDCDAFDSDVDKAPTTQTMFIANLSSADPITDESRPSYDSDILSEYVKDNEVQVVHSGVSSVLNDAFMMIYNDMCEPSAPSVFNTSRNVAIGYKNPLCLTRAKQAQPALYNGHEILKDNHALAKVHNTKDTLEIAEITRKKMNAKMTDPECVTRKGIQKALIKEIKEIKDVFKGLEAKVAQCAVDRKHDAIDRKNLIIANDNLIAECLSQEVFFVEINSELNVARFAKMHVANTSVEARCLALEANLANLRDKSHHENQEELINHFPNLRAENDKVQQHYKELYDSIKITRAKHIKQVTKLTTENVTLKTSVSKDKVKPQILTQAKHAIDVKPIVPRLRNNRDAHLDYLRKKQVTIAKPSDRQDSNKHIHVVAVKPKKTNVPVPHSTEVKSCPKASGSQPKSNPKIDRILLAKGANKLPVEDQPRTNKSHLRTTNHVDSSSRLKRTVTQIVLWYLDSGCSKPMMKDRPLHSEEKSSVHPYNLSSMILQKIIWHSHIAFKERHLDLKDQGLQCCKFYRASSHNPTLTMPRGSGKSLPRGINSTQDLTLHHLSNDELVLGYLKFSAKGTKREVFGMPIPGSLITVDIREASHYQEYQENVAKHRRFMASETGIDQDSPAPKPTKPARKPKSTAQKAPPMPSVSTPVASAQRAPTLAPAKLQENKRKQATKTGNKPAKTKRIKHSAAHKSHKPRYSPKSVGASEAEKVPTVEPHVADEDADYQKAVEESMKPHMFCLKKAKKKCPVEQYIFQRRIFEPAGSSLHDKSPYVVLGQSDSKEESKNVLIGATKGGNDEDQAGPNLGAQAEGQTGKDADTLDEGQARSNPDEMSEGQAGPDPGNDGNEEQSILSPVVHAGSDREHMDLDVADVSPQPSTEKLDKGTHHGQSDPSKQRHGGEVGQTWEASAYARTIEHPPTGDHSCKRSSHGCGRLGYASATTQSLQRLTGALEKSMNCDHSKELAQDLAEARKKKKKCRESPKTPPGSPPHQPPPLPPPTGPFGPLGAPGAFGSSQVPPPPPPPPPPSTSQDSPSKGSATPSPSKTATSTEYQAWMTPDVTLRPFISLTHADLEMDEDMGLDKQAQLSDDEDIESAYIPKVNLRQDWWKPLEEERIATPEPAWSISSSDVPVTPNNWVSALALNYSPPPEDSLLVQTGDMATFIDWFCKRRGITELKPQDLEGLAFEIIKVFHPDAIHLQYQMEECYKLLTDSVDDPILRNNVSKPLPLGGPPGQVTIQSDFFFNKDLEYLRYGSKGNRPALSISKMNAAYYPDAGLEQMVPD